VSVLAVTTPPSPDQTPRPVRSSHAVANHRVGDRLSCEVVRNLADTAHLQPEWDEIVAGLGGPIGATFDWCRTWWQHYAGRREARIFLFRAGNDLVGFAPMLIDNVRLGPASLRIARMLGTDFLPTAADLMVRSPWARPACDELLQRLIVDERCDAVHLRPLRADTDRFETLERVIECRSDLVVRSHDRILAPHTSIALPAKFSDYLKMLPSGPRSQFERDWNRLASDFDVATEIVREPVEVSADMHGFMRQHEAQWRLTGKLGRFVDWPQSGSFHRRLMDAMAGDDRVRILRLWAGGEIVARQLCLISGGVGHCLASARATGRRWSRCGVGRVALVRLLEHLIEEGIHTADTGPGLDEYKTRLGARGHTVRSLLLTANTPGARRRARTFCDVSDAVDQVYRRLFREGVAPHLPGAGRPLWSRWIRSRI